LDIITGIWSSRLGVGRKADALVLQKNFAAKSNEVKTGSNLAEFSKEGYCSQRGFLPMMLILITLLNSILIVK
jgi:hypothetical protein